MDRGAGDQIGTVDHEGQRDDRAVGVADHVHHAPAEVLDQTGQVGGVLGPTARPVTVLAAGMATTIPRHHLEPLRQPLHRRRPTAAISPGPVGQHESRPGAGDLVMQLDTVRRSQWP